MLAFHLLLTLDEVCTLIVTTILIAMGKTDRFKEVTMNRVRSMLVFQGSCILMAQALPRMLKIKKDNCKEFILVFHLLLASEKVINLMVAAIPRVLIETDPIQGFFTLITGTIAIVYKKTVGFQRRLTNELQQENAELQRQCAELTRIKKCLEESQRKVQQLEQRNEELEEQRKHQNEYATELDRYEMGGAPRGICLVINNFNFSGEEERQGSKSDEEAIARLFNELHFIVEIRQNLGGLEIQKVAQEMAARDHSNYGAFVLCVMSHGDRKDVIYGVDNRKAGMEDLMSEFTPTNCPTLENKPKLFFIQACRGNKSDRRMNRLTESTENIAEDGIQTMNSPDADLANGLSAREADFLLAFATVPGYKAWRSKQAGSWFIQVLVDVIRTYHRRHHLLDMLTEVNKQVADIANKYPDVDLSFQVPAPTHTLRAQVFL